MNNTNVFVLTADTEAFPSFLGVFSTLELAKKAFVETLEGMEFDDPTFPANPEGYGSKFWIKRERGMSVILETCDVDSFDGVRWSY